MSSAMTPETTPAQPSKLFCNACGGENAPNSRFCRHCGQEIPSVAPAPVQAAAPAPAAAVVAPPVGNDVDQGRARQLLDRALQMEERGDMQGAILACRQSVALSPQSAPAYSMLGLLWERTGNIQGAIAAYEKVVALSPESMLERESLQRLRSRQGHGQPSAVFHFDDGELFEGTAPPATDGAASSAISPANASTAVAAVGAGAAGTVASGDVHAAHGRVVSDTLPALDTAEFDHLSTAPNGLNQWLQTMMRQPSFYLRGLPLMAAAVLSIGFLLWARGYAASRTPVVVTPTTTTDVINNVTTLPPDAGGAAPVTNADAGADAAGAGGATIASPPAGSAVAGSEVNNAPSPANAGTATGSAAGESPPARTTTPRGTSVAPPAPGRAQPVPAMPSVRDVESLRGMPEPRIAPRAPSGSETIRITQPTAAPPAVTSPTDSGGASPGGAPMRPGGAPSRGIIRITPQRSSLLMAPPRPERVARDAERAASAAARAGNPDRAIERVTSAMQGGDSGWHFQQRGLLFLEKGDNARAIDDFQAAIAAYREQVRRGVRVAEAQAGIRACLSGWKTAVANMGR